MSEVLSLTYHVAYKIFQTLQENTGTIIDEYTLDIELSSWRGKKQFGECAVKTRGTWQQPAARNSPCFAF